MRIIGFVFVFALFLACKNTNSTETPKAGNFEEDSLTLADPLSPGPQSSSGTNIPGATFYALVDKLRVRDQPGTKGKVLAQLPEAATMTAVGEASDFTDRIKLRDQWIEAPWLKIKTEKGMEGWVFGGAVATQLPLSYLTKTPYDECAVGFVRDRDRDKYNRCMKQKADSQLQKDQRYVQKHKNGYTVKLLSGEKINLENAEDPPNAENYQKYAYYYYLDKMGYFVFRVDRYETTDFLLMDDKHGNVNTLYGLPRMSPDRRKLVVVSFEPVDGEGRYAIQLLSRGDNGLETVFEEEVTNFLPLNPRWLDDKNVAFDFLSPPEVQKSWSAEAKLIEVTPGNWQLNISNRRIE